MGTKLKIFGISVTGLITILVAIFLIGLAGLGYYKFFEPRKENIRREVFEQTQSYTHGNVRALAKYYEEYNKSNSIEDKEAVRQVILFNFAEFDESKIKAVKLKNFLITMRGY